MNCGAVEITGSGGDQSAFDALPDMTIMSIMDKEQSTPFADVKFANPGDSVEINLGSLVYTQIGAGSGSGAGSTAAPPATSAPVASPTATAPGGVFVTVDPQPTTSAAVPTSAPVVEAPTSASSSPAAAPTAGSGLGSIVGALTGACTVEGTFNCIGGTSFQQCGSGIWSVVTNMAAGTECTAGQSTSMKIAAIGKKRTARAFRA